MIVLVVISYALLWIYEFLPLINQKLYRDFAVNMVFWLLSFLAAMLLALGVKMFGPLRVVENIIVSIFGR